MFLTLFKCLTISGAKNQLTNKIEGAFNKDLQEK